MAKIIGLIMIPKTKPNLDHSLFKKNNASALTKTIIKKATAKTKKIKAVIKTLLKKKIGRKN